MLPASAVVGSADLLRAVEGIRAPVSLYRASDGSIGLDGPGEPFAVLPPLYPEWLGDPRFQEQHGTRFAYAAGSMANGIATPALVEAMARHGMLGFFGAAGLSYERVVRGLDELAGRVPAASPWGANLIHAPSEPQLELGTARLYLERQVRFVEASAFLELTPAVALLAAQGLRRGADGRIQRPRAIFAKVSRPEVARQFLRPAPRALLAPLVESGALTAEEAGLAEQVSVATDLTAEADSGGHTDNRPLVALLPQLLALRDELVPPAEVPPPRVGAAGGLGTPAAVAAAFALGADYVMTGSVNQAAVESGLSPAGREMLAAADLADVAMAAAADMFEMGVKVQVLRRGTLFAARANRLYELYRAHTSLEALPAEDRRELEEKVFRAPLVEIWRQTLDYWRARDPAVAARAERDPEQRMALVFRWYLGMASRWAISGEPTRRGDYQIWCGPAMGAFNAWTRGTFLADPAERTAGQIALNLLEGACVHLRAQALRAAGLTLPAPLLHARPRRLELS